MMISEVILFVSLNFISSFGTNLGDMSNNIKQAAKDHGIIFDANLCFDYQVKNVVWFLPAQDTL